MRWTRVFFSCFLHLYNVRFVAPKAPPANVLLLVAIQLFLFFFVCAYFLFSITTIRCPTKIIWKVIASQTISWWSPTRLVIYVNGFIFAVTISNQFDWNLLLVTYKYGQCTVYGCFFLWFLFRIVDGFGNFGFSIVKRFEKWFFCTRHDRPKPSVSLIECILRQCTITQILNHIASEEQRKWKRKHKPLLMLHYKVWLLHFMLYSF